MKLYKETLIFTRLLKNLAKALQLGLTCALVTHCGLVRGKERRFAEPGRTAQRFIVFTVCCDLKTHRRREKLCGGRVPRARDIEQIKNQTNPVLIPQINFLLLCVWLRQRRFIRPQI